MRNFLQLSPYATRLARVLIPAGSLALFTLIIFMSTAYAIDCGSVNSEVTLNTAIACANAAGAGLHTITLSGNIALTASTTAFTNIDGVVAVEGNGFTVDGQNISGVRVFEISEGAIVAMNAITITGGNMPVDSGGGILNSGVLTLTNSTVTGNQSGIAGGGIANEDTLTVIASTISNNTANGGQALGEGGGIDNSFALATIINTTISGNSADLGGGLNSSNSEVSFFNTTISNNSSDTTQSEPTGGGVNSTGEGVVTLYNTIVANQAAGEDCAFFATEGFSTLESGGNNLDSDGTCLNADSLIQPSDIANGAANLGSLQVNAPGATATHALLTGSDAIDNGDNTLCANTFLANGVDQRGVTRPQGPTCDIGAYEANTGAIVIIKVATPKDGADFSFSGDLGLFSLDDTFAFNNDNDGITNTKSFVGLAAGFYTVNEAAIANWQLDAIDCQSTDQADAPVITSSGVTIDLSVNETVTCTFNNLGDGQLVIVKEASVATSQPFTFTDATLGDFVLIDDGTGISDTITFTVPGNTGYSVSEAAPPGWQQVGQAFCSNEDNADDVFVSAGETVTCTFINQADPAAITIVKSATPADGTDFDFQFDDGQSPLSFTLDDALPDDGDAIASTRLISNLLPGDYTISESVPAGWALTGVSCSDGGASIAASIDLTLLAGTQITCTFRNTQRGSLTIQKATIPAGVPDSFTFSGDLTGSIGDGGQLAANDLLPGQYTVSEQDTAPNFFLTSLVCDDGASATPSSVDINARTATVNIDPGETVICTFTNTAGGAISVTKTPNVTTAAVSGNIIYTYRITNSGPVTLTNVMASDDKLGPVTLNTTTLAPAGVAVGTLAYTVQESDLPGPLGNTVVVTGTPPAGPLLTASANATVNLISAPILLVAKSPNVALATVGDTITYTYRITNTGDVTLSNLVARDDKLGAVTLAQTTLAPGESTGGLLTYAVVGGDLPGPLVNTVVVTGTPPVGEPVVNSAGAAVAIFDLPSIRVSVTGDPPSLVEPGGVVDYTVVVTNTSASELTLIALEKRFATPTAAGAAPAQAACTVPQSMAAGGVYTCLYQEQLTGQDGDQIEFIVTGTGRNAAGREASDSDNEFTPILAVPTDLDDEPEPEGFQHQVLLPLVAR